MNDGIALVNSGCCPPALLKLPEWNVFVLAPVVVCKADTGIFLFSSCCDGAVYVWLGPLSISGVVGWV